MTAETKPKILILTPFYRPGFKGGGPIKSVVNLTEALSDEFEFRVLTGCREMGEKEPFPGIQQNHWTDVGRASVYYSSGIFSMWKEYLAQTRGNGVHIAYFQGLFNWDYTLVPLILRSFSFGNRRVPALVFPRGQLSDGALSLSKSKKQFFLKLWGLMLSKKKLFFQATNSLEETEIRSRTNFGGEVFVAANVPDTTCRSETRADKSINKLKMVFLSRISPKKNLKYAIERLWDIPKDIEIEFDIYGPLEDSEYWAECQNSIKQCPQNVAVKYCGKISPPEVLPTLEKYEVFFFPTHGENYGHVIVEALAAGLALVISDQTPWLELRKAGVGHALPLDQPETFTKAICNYTKMTSEEFDAVRSAVASYTEDLVNSKEAIDANRMMLRQIASHNN